MKNSNTASNNSNFYCYHQLATTYNTRVGLVSTLLKRAKPEIWPITKSTYNQYPINVLSYTRYFSFVDISYWKNFTGKNLHKNHSVFTSCAFMM
jgi:hypothetical protein